MNSQLSHQPNRAQNQASARPIPRDQPPTSLGRLLAIRSWGIPRRRFWLTRLAPGLALMAISLGYGLWRWYYGYTRFGVVAARTWSRPGLILSGSIALVLIVLLIRRVSTKGRFVGLYHNGLRIHLDPQHKRVLRWDEIAGMTSQTLQEHFLGLPLAKRHRLTILPLAGSACTLDDRLQGLPEFAALIKERYYQNVRPRLHHQLEANHWLAFGPLGLHRQALRSRDRRIPWEEIEAIKVQKASLVIELKQGRDLRIPTAQIPNLELLLDLIRTGVTA